MQLTTLVSALLVGSAIAAPHTAKRQQRAAERAAKRSQRHSQPVHWVENPVNGNTTEVSYSSNWAGAVLVGTGYTSVTGEFTAPSPSSSGSGSAWVGIDGDTCGTAILQTGIDWTYDDGEITYDAWYEWYPDYAYDFSGISISEGDTIKVTVTATGKSAGSAVVENVSTGTSKTHTFTSSSTEADLCEYNAEWIVEDFEEGSSLVSFADFGTVEFSSASATKSGSKVGVTGATIIDIEQGSDVLTTCTLPSSSSVKCVYK